MAGDKLGFVLLGDPGPGAQEKDRWLEFPWVDSGNGKAILKKGRINGGLLVTALNSQGGIINSKLLISVMTPDNQQFSLDPSVVRKIDPPTA